MFDHDRSPKATIKVSRPLTLAAVVLITITLTSYLLSWKTQPLKLPFASLCSCNSDSDHAAAGKQHDATHSNGTATYSRVFADIPFAQDFTAAHSEEWKDMFSTEQGGFLVVQRNETFQERWGVSMFHGLHCMQMLRERLRMTTAPDENHHHHHHGEHHHSRRDGYEHQQHAADVAHLEHCVAYVAQLLLCAGDDTIEPPEQKYDAAGHVVSTDVNGLDVVHQCRDTSHVRKVVQNSEREAVQPFAWREGDRLGKVFPSLELH